MLLKQRTEEAAKKLEVWSALIILISVKLCKITLTVLPKTRFVMNVHKIFLMAIVL